MQNRSSLNLSTLQIQSGEKLSSWTTEHWLMQVSYSSDSDLWTSIQSLCAEVFLLKHFS